MALPYTIDSLLAKQNLFYDECKEVAQTIADELIEADRHNDEDEDIEEYVLNAISIHASDMMSAYADDLLNSYGIARAVREYFADCKERGIGPCDPDEGELHSQGIVMVIMEKPVMGPVKHLLYQHRRSLQASS